MFKKFKAFYNKENFDFSKGDVDPYKFHFTVYYFCKAFQVLDGEPIPKWTYFVLTTMAFMSLFSNTLAVISIYHGVCNFDIQNITEAGTYLIILSYKLLILSTTQTNVKNFNDFLCTVRGDFKYVCSEGSKYRKKYFELQLETWKICLWSIMFIGGVAGIMVTFSSLIIIYLLIFQSENQRPMLFPFWIWDIDLMKSPIYEILFIYSIVSILAFGYNYIFMMQTQIFWVRQITAKCDLITWFIEDLFEDIRHSAINSEERKYYENFMRYRMKKIIVQHHSMYDLLQDYSSAYKKLLMFEQKLCAPVVCMTAYCAAEKLDKGEIHLILIMLCSATIVLVFIPSYLCTFLAFKISSICDACWHAKFWHASSVIRPYMVLIMQRSLRRLPLQAAGFEPISVETFSNKMGSAYSFFNMLRQLDI